MGLISRVSSRTYRENNYTNQGAPGLARATIMAQNQRNNGAALPTRVAERSRGAMAHGWDRSKPTPSLQSQSAALLDVKEKIAQRLAQMKGLSTEQISLKAHQTTDRTGPLRQQDLLRKTVVKKEKQEYIKEEEFGQKKLVKNEYKGPKEGGLNKNWGDMSGRLALEKERLLNRIKANGGTRFSTTTRIDDDISMTEYIEKPKGFDSLGRPLDKYGQVMELVKPDQSLKINKRAGNRAKFQRKYLENLQKRDESQEEQLEKAAKLVEAKVEESGALAADVIRPDDIAKTSQFFDPRMKEKKSARDRRSFFDFQEEGTFIKKGQMMRQQAQLKTLQVQIENLSKRTGVQQASKLATVAHSAVKDTMALTVNELDWWDKNLLPEDEHNIEEDFEEYHFINVSNYIEHPIEMVPPMKNTATAQLPVYLTKKERRKIRRLRRREEQKEEQEKIRLGLVPVPEEQKCVWQI